MYIDNDDSNTLLMFSGGLDSTGALWQLLQNKENKVHIHHLHLINKEKRAKAEHIAVKNIISYISRHYKIKYSESYHEYPYYSYLSMMDNNSIALNENFMFDSDLYNFIAGTICTSLPNIKTMAIGRTKSDLENTEIIGRTIIGTSIFKLLAPNVEKVYPVGHMTKSEVYSIIPEDLRSMTWSCRIPIYTSENTIQECGKCKTCLELHRVKYGI
jgi:7-cyano-7-deazaguanine synthase in queuosine biosynthesis